MKKNLPNSSLASDFTALEIDHLRRNYSQRTLNRANLSTDPFYQFDHWFKEASMSPLILEANAMVLATAGSDLHVTARTVLLKGYDKNGFRFFTNTTSFKGKQIADNPRVALLFSWIPLERQIQINGTASLLPEVVTEQYFHSRPRESQLAAWASQQSLPLLNRKELEDRMSDLRNRFMNTTIPVPDYWNGYLVEPDVIEFWQGRNDRLHDRFRYTKDTNAMNLNNEWTITRLNP